MTTETTAELARAWERREQSGAFDDSEAVRVFHGPGEGTGALRSWAIDRFGDHYWLTEWEGAARQASPVAAITSFLRSKGAQSAVCLGRPERGVPSLPEPVFGTPPADRFVVDERGARYAVALADSRHPGLFLDHAPLRTWLRENARGWRVLNTFAYTGSLSVAAALGGASHVTTLDLSKATIRWAEANGALNDMGADRARYIFGDVFEWFPRLGREGAEYDCVIVDPPSFSRGKKGTFSTAKDLTRLHALALDRICDGGVLVTSINSANVSWSRYRSDVEQAAGDRGARLEPLWQVRLPDTFPTRTPDEHYLKGWAFRVRRR